MASVLATDHPAWHTHENHTRVRAVRTESGIWVVSQDGEGLHMQCVEDSEDVKPVFVATDSASLPAAAPAALRTRLEGLGVIKRLANPWLWDAMSTAILRQVVRAHQARKLYRAWCRRFGVTIQGHFGELAVAPAPADVLALGYEEFAGVGAKFHRTALRAAAAAYEQNLAQDDADESMRQRDEFNFSVGLQFGGVPLEDVRGALAMLTREQHQRDQGGREVVA